MTAFVITQPNMTQSLDVRHIKDEKLHLEIRDLHNKLKGFSSFLHTRKQLMYDTRYDACHLLNTINANAVGTSHCVCLAAARLTIGQNSGIVTCTQTNCSCTQLCACYMSDINLLCI